MDTAKASRASCASPKPSPEQAAWDPLAVCCSLVHVAPTRAAWDQAEVSLALPPSGSFLHGPDKQKKSRRGPALLARGAFLFIVADETPAACVTFPAPWQPRDENVL